MPNKTRPNNHGASETRRQRQQEILRQRAKNLERGQDVSGGASFRKPKADRNAKPPAKRGGRR